MSKIIFDDDLYMDSDKMIVGSDDNKESGQMYNLEELDLQIDKLEAAIDNLETSLDPDTVSFLSGLSAEGVYHKAGLLTNIVLGMVIAAVFILLLI